MQIDERSAATAAKRRFPESAVGMSIAALLSLAGACGGDDSSALPPLSIGGAPGIVTSTAGASAMLSPTGVAGSMAMAPVSMQTPAQASNPTPASMNPATGAAGSAGMPHTDHPGGPTSPDSMTPMEMQAMSACKLHAAADPRDAMLTDKGMEITVGLEKDVLMPQLVLDWMDEYQFAEAHDGWHLVRKWDQTCRKSNATSCTAAKRLEDQGLKRAPIQQGAPGDGLAFMMMHRHMIMMLNVAFPSHPSLFAGFTKVPRTQNDPANPHPWSPISWTSSNITGFDTLENIEQHLDKFPTEDDLGQYIENTYRWTAQSPMSPLNQPGSGLHGALHAQWAVNGSPANLIQQAVDVKNYAFWKLHGWIDNVWERYRKAKGLKDDDPAYQKLMLEQCMEMFMLQPRNRGMTTTGGTTSPGTAGTGAVAETGVFAQNVRPFLDSTCGGCHSAIAPSAGMTLGGSGITSAEILDGLIGQKASNGQFNLIEPGAPQRSWVYLKASGESASAMCATACDREKMPPSGSGLSAAQLTTLRDWIMSGAPRK